MRFSPHFQLFYFNDRLEFCEFFEWKIKRINNADLFSQPPLVIFTKGANISGGHCMMLDSNYPLQPPCYPLSAAYIWKIYNSAILFFHPMMLAWTVHSPLAHDEGTCCTHSRVLSSRPLAILSDTYTQSSVRVNGRGPSGTEPTHPFKTLSFSSLIYQKRSTWGTEAIM